MLPGGRKRRLVPGIELEEEDLLDREFKAFESHRKAYSDGECQEMLDFYYD